MSTRPPILAAVVAAAALTAPAAQAVPIDFSAYFRAGAGTSDEGGKEVCTRLPGSAVWFRLGNECDTYADLTFKAALGEVSGTKFRTQFRFSYGTQGVANWEQTSPSWREVFVAADDIGAAMQMPALRGATLWAGKRFYGNRDIHMLDYGFWEPNQGFGAGLENVDVGIGKFSYAVIRMGDSKGYGINDTLGGFNPDLIGGGSRTVTNHDLRIEEIAVNPNGKLSVGIDLAFKNNRDGASTYTVDVPTPLDLDNDPTTPPVTVIVRETRTIDNDEGRNGLGLHLQHTQSDFLGLGGFNQVVLKFAKDAMTLRGVGIAGSTEQRREWLLFDHWVMEPKGSPWTMSATAGVRQQRVRDPETGRWNDGREFWIGARPQFHLNEVWSLVSEIGHQQAKVDGDPNGTRKLTKLTLGTQFSMGRSIWSRPAIRFYGTWAKWNDAAALADSGVTCTGRDCGRPVPVYNEKGKRSAVTYGVQIEGWF